MAIKLYVSKLESDPEEAARYLEDEARKGKGGILGTVESRQFALQLFKLESYMGHTTALTSKWIKQHILNTYGGVSKPLVITKDADHSPRYCAG